MIELDVVDYLTNDSALYTLLGASGSDSKFYAVQLPLKKVSEPYIIFTTNAIGGLEENLLEVSMSFNCMDSSYLVAKSIKDRLHYLLDRQDAIQNLITSTDYMIYWAKEIGGSIFKETGLKLFHFATIYDFKYAELKRGAIDVINKFITYPIHGTFIDEKVFINGIYFPASVTIKKIAIHSDAAPTGADVTIDILKNDVEQSRIATLTVGSKDQLTDITDISFGTSDKLGFKFKSVGTGEPGEGGTLEIQYQ